jgi:hypothetical protein
MNWKGEQRAIALEGNQTLLLDPESTKDVKEWLLFWQCPELSWQFSLIQVSFWKFRCEHTLKSLPYPFSICTFYRSLLRL